MRFLSLLGFFALVFATPVFGQSDVTSQVKRDLEAAQERLLKLRGERADDRRALSKALTESQSELLTKRRQADLSRRSVSDQAAYLKGLQAKEYASSVAELSLLDGLRTFGIQLETRLFPGEAKDARLESAVQRVEAKDVSIGDRLLVLELGLARLERALGGTTYSAQVTTEKSEVIQGEILSFGPSLWFQAADGSVAGSYHLSKSARVGRLDPDDAKTAKALLAGEEAVARIDITGGKAKALASIQSGPIDLIKKGGAWVYPILLLAVFALIFAIRKALALQKIRDLDDETIIALAQKYHSGDQVEAIEDIRALRHPVAEVIPPTAEVIQDESYELADEVLYERLIPVRERLRCWLPFLAVTAAVAPLLGLLGTVSGLIKTFSVIAIEGTGEAQSISGGISEALITTLFGLTVAIPVFMAHALLSRRAKGIEQNSERLALVFLNQLRKRGMKSD